MLKLGGKKRLPILVTNGDGVETPVVLVYRPPESSEWIAFDARKASLYGQIPQQTLPEGVQPQVPPEVLVGFMEATRDLASAILLDAEGVEPEDGLAPADVVRRYGPGLLLHLGQHLSQHGGLSVAPGKSEPPSA